MGRDYDDRDYWREQDYRRELLDREFWTDYDQRRDDAQDDLQYETQRRAEADERAWDALRSGDVTEALRNLMGPEAALGHLQSLDAASTGAGRRIWVRHGLVSSLDELTENVEQAPTRVRFELDGRDDDGDLVVRVVGDEHRETFWVQEPLLSALSPLTGAPARTRLLIERIIVARDGRSPASFLRSGPLSAFHPLPQPASDAPQLTLPHAIIHDLEELAENLRAAPRTEWLARRLDDDGDAVIHVREGEATATCWIRSPLLAQLASLAPTLAAFSQLVENLDRLKADDE